MSFQWAAVRKALSVIFTPFHQVFVYIDKMPLELHLHQATQSQLSQPPLLSLSLPSYPFIIFLALCCTHSSISTCDSYWGAQHWARHSSHGPSGAEQRGRMKALLRRQPRVLVAFWINRAQEGVIS